MKSTFAEGPTGSVYFDGKTITVTRTGTWAHLTQMAGKVSIPIELVARVRFVPARLTQGQGFIQFVRKDDPLADVRHRSYGRKDEYGDANLDELSCRFRRTQQRAFEEVRDAVAAAIGVPVVPELLEGENEDSPLDFSSKGAAVKPDVTDQIRKLAELRDDGILTEEEFAKKKAELLDRI